MQNSVFSRKIACPSISPQIIHRGRLITKMQEAITEMSSHQQTSTSYCKCILVNAPAGYGKTTLLVDFARHIELPCCWYILDAADIERVTFLKTLFESIRRQFPRFGSASASFFANLSTEELKYHHPEALLDIFIAMIASEIKERFIFVLCNYHEISKSESIKEIISYLLQKMPKNCIFAIESRSVPDINLSRFIARMELCCINSNMLQFTAQEIIELVQLQDNISLTLSEAEQLVETFDGWITGILLGTQIGGLRVLSSYKEHMLPNDFHIHPNHQYLLAYIVDEVFKHEPHIYEFLRQAIILKQMSPTHCAQLLNECEAGSYLLHLEQQELFVKCDDASEEIIYSCHPILRELLYEELRHKHPDRFRALHTSAAEIMYAAKNFMQAIEHALEACNYDLAAKFLIEAGEALQSLESVDVISHLIDGLPGGVMEAYPALYLMRANIHLFFGEYASVFALLDIIGTLPEEDTLSSTNPQQIPAWFSVHLTRSKALFQAGEYVQAQKLCQKVLHHTTNDQPALRIEAYLRLGICTNMLGDFVAGISFLQKALQLRDKQILSQTEMDIHGALASSYSLLGNFALAEHHLTRAIQYCEQNHDERSKSSNLNRLGLLKLRQGNFVEAESVLNQALKISRDALHFQRGEAYTLVNLGELYQYQRLYNQSLAVIENGLVLARMLGDKYLLNSALSVMAMTYLYMNDAETALLLISDTDIQLHPLHEKEIGYDQAIRQLSYGTILLYQQRYDEAWSYLLAAEAFFHKARLKNEHLQALLRIIACSKKQKDKTEDDMIYWLRQASKVVQNEEYLHILSIEVQRIPDLKIIIETEEDAVDLRRVLKLEDRSHTKKDIVQETVNEIASVLEQPDRPHIMLTALGEPSVHIDDLPVTRWGLMRAMELCFFLQDCNRPMRKEQIITALWPEIDKQIDQKFYSTIYHLRKVLGEACITSHGSVYSFDLGAVYGRNIHYDVQIFYEEYSHVKQALKEGSEQEARGFLMKMIHLYRGDYAQSFYSDWCLPQRDTLRRMLLDAHRQTALITQKNEEFDECITHWQAMLSIDSCIEDAHYGLMRCYTRMGKRDAALRQYQQYAEILHHEFSALPGQTMQNFHQRLLGSSFTGANNISSI